MKEGTGLKFCCLICECLLFRQKTLHELSATFVLDYEQLKIRNVDDFEKAASFVDYCVIAVALNLHW